MKSVMAIHSFSCTAAPLEQLPADAGLLQSAFWAGIKAQFGWKPLCIKAVSGNHTWKLLVLYRELGGGLGLAYIPYPAFPEPENGAGIFLAELAQAIAPLLPAKTRFVRYDLAWHREGADNLPQQLATGRGLHKSPMDIQPPSTVLLDLRQTEEEILNRMKHKTRYNIKLAEKKGVEIIDGTAGFEENLKNWYLMYQETAARDKIVLHSYDYYRQLFVAARHPGNQGLKLKLLLARIETDFVAGIVVVFNGNQATYLYGASNNIKRNYMPNYLLQWQAICLAKEAGCLSYDFFGIPEKEDPGHPLYGLYRFKTGFGGTIINRYGCYDYALSQGFYAGYRVAEAVRKFYYKKLRKIFS